MSVPRRAIAARHLSGEAEEAPGRPIGGVSEAPLKEKAPRSLVPRGPSRFVHIHQRASEPFRFAIHTIPKRFLQPVDIVRGAFALKVETNLGS